MSDFKAAEGQLPLIVATPSAVKSAFDGQCWVMFFHIMFCVEKFIQHCLGLVGLFTIVFNNFFPTGRVAESSRPRLFKPK
jgi:hypothetical protein